MKIPFPILCFLCVPAVNFLSAQQADDLVSVEEEVVTLEEFQVTASAMKDEYIATEATSGTRLSEKITDLPYSVQVITDQFVQDFQIINDNELMDFVGGVSADHTGGTLAAGDGGGFTGSIRGFKAITVRDGFQFAMPGGPSNTLQTEFIRGPMSTLYGRAEPGGILNKVSRRPGTKQRTSVTGIYGTDDYKRFAVSSTGPLGKERFNNKLFYRAYLDYVYTEGYFGPSSFEYAKRYYAGLSLLYKFRPSTSLVITTEYQPQRARPPGSISQYYDSRSGFTMNYAAADGTVLARNSKIHRRWTGIKDYNPVYAPNSRREADYYGLNLLFEHRINRIWSHRSALQTFTKKVDKLHWYGPTQMYLYDAVRDSTVSEGYRFVWNGTITPDRVPYIQDFCDNAIAGQAELLARIRTSRIDHKILFAIDASFRKQDNKQYYYRSPSTGVPPIAGTQIRAYINDPFRDPNYGARLPNNLDDFYPYTDRDLTTNTFGAFTSYRASALRNRLALMASVRLTYYSDEVKDPYTPAFPAPEPGSDPLPQPNAFGGKKDDTKFTYSAGLNYQLNGERIVLFISTSSSFIPMSTVDNGTNTLIPPEEASSVELGFKGATENGKFGYTISAYDATLRNTAIDNPDYNERINDGESQYLIAGKQRTKGIDGSFTFKPTRNLFFGASFGRIHNRVLEATENTAFRIGKSRAGLGKWNAALWGRYDFKGHLFGINLKGLRIGLAATWRDSRDIYYESNTFYGCKTPSLLLLRGYINYEFKSSGKLTHKIAINGNNLLDKEYFTSNGRPFYGINGRITYSVSF